MNFFAVCYTNFHKAVRGIGLFLFFVISISLIYGFVYVRSNSVAALQYWIAVLILLFLWASLAFFEILIIRRHFLKNNDKVLKEFLAQSEKQKLERSSS